MDEEEILKAWGLSEDEDAEPEEELDEGTEDLDEEEPEDDGTDAEDQEEEPEPESEPDEEQEDPFRAERERLENQNRADREAALDAQVASLGLTDPYNGGTPITTNAQLLAFQARSRQEKLEQVAKAAGMTEEELKALIDQHPDVVAGKQLKSQMEQQAADAEKQRAERALMADIAQIGKLVPGIDSKAAVVGHESWPRVRKLLEDNPKLGLKDAFRLANADAIEAANGKKAQSAARRAAAGKNHLKAPASRGKGLPEVPEDVKQMYRAFDPGITDAEIRKDYAKNKIK